MGYYSFFRFLRSITYNLKSIIKYLCFCFLIIAFIIVCLLLMSCKVSGATLYPEYLRDYYVFEQNGSYYFHESNNTDTLLSNVDDTISKVFLVRENNPGQYTYNYFIFPENATATFYVDSNNDSLYFTCDTAFTVRYVGANVSSTDYNANSIWSVSHYNWYCPSPAIQYFYTDASRSSVFIENPFADTFNAPSFVNYDNSNWGNTLVNGEFNYFYIDGNDCESLIFYFGDITYANTTTDFPTFSVTLDSSSPYYYGNNMWAIDKNEPFGVYLNNHTYQLSLQYQRNDTWESVPYRWTTDFSQSVVDDQEQTTMGNIDKGISEMNSFFNDKSFNEQDITDKLPSPPTNEDITANGFNNIFDTLRQTFTTNSDLALVFHIPFSDGNITIPANLTENIVPDILKNLIRLVYWYLISRFIVKDIASYIEKAKNGTITDGTDTNIKTDML